MKTIAFDIDGTWTLDPETFHSVALRFVQAGWNVLIVSGAEQDYAKLARLALTEFHFICTSGRLKESELLALGYSIDVWVDNEPGTIQRCKVLDDSEDL